MNVFLAKVVFLEDGLILLHHWVFTSSEKKSRWIAKVPKEQRSLKKKAAPAAATDAMVGGAKRGMKKGMNFMKKGVGAVSSAAADATGIDCVAASPLSCRFSSELALPFRLWLAGSALVV